MKKTLLMTTLFLGLLLGLFALNNSAQAPVVVEEHRNGAVIAKETPGVVGFTTPSSYFYRFQTPNGEIDIRVSKKECDEIANNIVPIPPDGYKFLGCFAKEDPGGDETKSVSKSVTLKRNYGTGKVDEGKMTQAEFDKLVTETGKLK